LAVQNKKRPITFIAGDLAYLFSLIFKTLPIKDTLFFSSLIFFGVDIYIFFKTNQEKSQQKKREGQGMPVGGDRPVTSTAYAEISNLNATL
jgi:hypothetical protein